MKFAVVVVPGSNCDHDAYHAAKEVLGQDAAFVWHKDTSLKGADVVILPGGFAHGDYLRTGAIARFSPIMPAILEFVRDGGPVLGICNGFQVLLESGLLPGAMLRNRDLKFHCEHVTVRVEQTDTLFTSAAVKGQRLRLPIAHGEESMVTACWPSMHSSVFASCFNASDTWDLFHPATCGISAARCKDALTRA